ncbi:uncharacterized protein LAJ45_04908 [Morchella importuna]|uniref:uncharacterized protein n=1 Tax=Morchella importuna TaxID=1174673 RepID=UPI001E8E21B2|nr:uncharacterized protein LAJ45_04908 [Morchella importuna]KAH8151206.1 hypothetical protein LAJ45_04908 [Morchella importuna]
MVNYYHVSIFNDRPRYLKGIAPSHGKGKGKQEKNYEPPKGTGIYGTRNSTGLSPDQNFLEQRPWSVSNFLAAGLVELI